MFALVWFGDNDGTGSDVLLHHSLGVVYASHNKKYVIDSYSHKVMNHLLKLQSGMWICHQETILT